MKRINTWCASCRQHTLPHRRAASRSKPPNLVARCKIGVVRIKGGLSGGESTRRLRCQCSLAFVGWISGAHPPDRPLWWMRPSGLSTLPRSISGASSYV
nr:hypothetical protein [Methylomarinum sp. Ch1-1]MDP4522879.1 hypothetical protein [Methylomarinum sp. Ch1-1]